MALPPCPPGKESRVPNLSPEFVEEFAGKLGLEFVSDGRGDLKKTVGPEDIFKYADAVFHSPTYRERYAEFLKIDFPRLPLTSDVELFRTLVGFGGELVGLHLLEAPEVGEFVTSYPVRGDNLVDRGYPKYLGPGETALTPGPSPTQWERGETLTPGQFPTLRSGQAPAEQERGVILQNGRVYINKAQYFEGVPPEVWEFQVGGYQVCDKWLKDRKGRELSFDDLQHYQRVVVALRETIRLMGEVDEAIGEWPIS